MKITVTNNQAAGTAPVPCIDSTSVLPGASHEMTGRSRDDLVMQMAQSNGDTVIVRAELEANDRSPLLCVMKTPSDPGSGVGTLAACGFDLLDEAAAAASVTPPMYMGVFQDADCTVPATTATLDTAATGTIDDGGGTYLLEVTPAAGVLSVTLTDSADEVVYLKAWPMDSSYAIDTSTTHTATFIP